MNVADCVDCASCCPSFHHQVGHHQDRVSRRIVVAFTVEWYRRRQHHVDRNVKEPTDSNHTHTSKMFLSRRYRPNMWPYYILFGLELCLTIALLALFGIAQPNLYRTKLWQDGANNGFNSSPLTGLYAHANYKPYTTPPVWSQFITSYNVVIVVLSMFMLLVKSIMYMLHVFPPILSGLLHGVLLALYIVSVYYQASSDTTDPEHPQHGPPWYITKSCSVAFNPKNVHYCTQAKAAFACTCAILAIFFTYLCLAIWSCIPSKEQKIEHDDARKARKEKWSRIEAEYEEAQKEAAGNSTSYPETPGAQLNMNPYTPRTQAFNTLGGTTNAPRAAPIQTSAAAAPSASSPSPISAGAGPNRDLPLRNHFSSPNRPVSPPSQPQPQTATAPAASSSLFQIRSPDFPRSPMNMPGYGVTAEGARSPGLPSAGLRSPPAINTSGMRSPGLSSRFGKEPARESYVTAAEEQPQRDAPQMFFPPPPKQAVREGKGKKGKK